MRSLKSKLLVVIISVVVLSNVLIGMVSQIVSLNVVTKSVNENLSNVASKIASEIYAVNEKQFSMMESLATQPFMKNPDVSLEEKNDAVGAIARRNLTKFKNVSFISKEGLTYSLGHTLQNSAGEKFFQEAMGGSRVVLDPVFDKAAGQTLMYYAVPVYNAHHVPQGVIAAITFGDTLSQIVSVMQVGKNSHPVVVNMKTGAIIGRFEGEGGSVSIPSDIMLDLRAGRKGSASYKDSSTGQRMTCAFRPVGENCDWAVFCAAPYEDYFGGLTLLSKLIPIILALTVISATVACVILLSRSLRPLKNVDGSIHEIATGNADLTKRIDVKTKDEIGSVVNGFNIFVGKLQAIISQVKISRNSLSRAGDDLDTSTQETASSIAEIIANIQSVHRQISMQSGSVSETVSAVNQIASNIESLEKMISRQSEGVSQASSSVEEMIGNISAVTQSVEKMADSFSILHDDAKLGAEKQVAVNDRISKIETQSIMLQEANKTIENIAYQTNLLAMNAAIEAAHAGNAGLGFSVVADEIRSLSETSRIQSKTIGTQLKAIKESIVEVVGASADSSRVFNSVSEKIEETDQLVRQIKAAMAEQSVGSKQIIGVLRTMNDSTSEVRTASREMSEGNRAILDEVKNLKQATDAMLTSMDEMSIGARKINETGTALSEISTKLRDSISEIGGQIDQFTV